MMQTQELNRIRYITQTYEALKGLKIIPFGLFMCLMAFRQLGWTILGKEGDCTYTLPLFILLLVLYFAIDKYYNRTFGVVRTLYKTSSLAYLVIFLAIFCAAVGLEIVFKLPFSLIGLTIGGMLIYSGAVTRRPYYSIAGIAIMVISLVPLLLPATASGKAFLTYGFWWNITLGLTWVVLGLVDHWMLVRAMKPARGAEDA